MTHTEMYTARIELGLEQEELAALMEVDVTSVRKWERAPDLKSYRAPPARAERLMQAFKDGWRPADWPAAADKRVADRAALEEKMKEIRT